MSSSLAVIDNSVRSFTHDELIHIDIILTGGENSNASFEDLVEFYREFNWNAKEVTALKLKSIYKGEWAPTKIKGRETGMPSGVGLMKKEDLVSLMKRRMEATLSSMRSKQQENTRSQLQPRGVLLGDNMAVLVRHINGYDRALFFRSEAQAQAAVEYLDSYISGTGNENDLDLFRRSADQRNPSEIVQMFIQFAHSERRRSNLLIL